jgi:hypothetical protein
LSETKSLGTELTFRLPETEANNGGSEG